jgi:hypothetical protein
MRYIKIDALVVGVNLMSGTSRGSASTGDYRWVDSSKAVAIEADQAHGNPKKRRIMMGDKVNL